jgi:hypothetical protein
MSGNKQDRRRAGVGMKSINNRKGLRGVKEQQPRGLSNTWAGTPANNHPPNRQPWNTSVDSQ